MRKEFNFQDLDPLKDRLFFDYDGTVCPFVPSCQAARAFPPAGTVETFQKLMRAGFDIAFLSGRPIAEPGIGEPTGSIDAFMHPLKLAASGLHGFQWRRGYGGAIETPTNIPEIESSVFDGARALKQAFPAMQLEVKSPFHLTLHFREVSADRQQDVQDAIEEMFPFFLAEHPAYKFQYGEKIVEICPDEVDGIKIDKGMALERFMQASSDAKRPVFFGDDAARIQNSKLIIGTDESAMIAAQAYNGVAVLVGKQAFDTNSTSVATHFVLSPEHLMDRLRLLAATVPVQRHVPRIPGGRPVDTISHAL